MERLKSMKESLMTCAQSQIGGNLHEVDAKELGEVVDMIKDLEEAIYYCTIVKAMEEKDEEQKRQPMYYTPYMPKMAPDYYRDLDRGYDRMYYNGNPNSNSGMGGAMAPGSNGGNARNYDESYPMTVRDYREGNSPRMRKMYMESKEMHHDPAKKMQELEKYAQELTKDVIEMIEDATPDEKVLLKQKIITLAEKIK